MKAVWQLLLASVTLGSAIALEGCNPPVPAQSSEDNSIVVWDARWRLTPDEVDAYVTDHPRYLRIKIDPGADLLLDERFKVNRERDYMSVLATSYGAGRSLTLGKYRLLCQRTATVYYNCGLRFIEGGRTYVLVFKDQPDDSSFVEKLRNKAQTFIRERSTPHA